MELTMKETMFLQDLKAAEQTCVERYTRFAAQAKDGTLKNLFQFMLKHEQQHLDTVTKLLQGVVPKMGSGSLTDQFRQEETAEPNLSKEDKFLCDDALDSEKHASNLYNSSIFEFGNTKIREVLNHIQKEEQEHGEMLYHYMKPRGMYGAC